MKRYTLLAAMGMVLGGCAQLPEIADHSKPDNPKPAGDPSKRTNAPTNQVGDKRGGGQMIELRVIDDEMRTKLGLNSVDDMLLTLTNEANETEHTILLYVSKELDKEFMAAPGEFIHSKKLEKYVQIFSLSGVEPLAASTPMLMTARPGLVENRQSLTASARVVCKNNVPDGNGGTTSIPKPPCPIKK